MTIKINYKELLIKYIAYIGYQEGISFIDDVMPSVFSKDEITELQKLDNVSNSIIIKYE